MATTNSVKNWFWKMWALALLAVFGLVASPVFASNCCCDEMAETGHSHSGVSRSSARVADHHENPMRVNRSTTFDQASVSNVCQHEQCEVAPLFVGNDQSKSSVLVPVAVSPVQPFLLQTPNVLTVSTFANRVARPRVPDRDSCSGLSPPAPQWS